MGRTSDAEQRLIEEATSLWYSRSYADVGVSEICDAAGVRKGSFYHFFPSKRDLALAVLDRHAQTFRERVVERVAAHEGTAMERLDLVGQIGAEFLAETAEATGTVCGCPVGNLAVELSTIDDTLRRRFDAMFRERIAFLRSLLDAAVAEGSLPAGTDTDLVAESLNAYYEGILAMAKTAGDAGLLRRLAPLAIGLVRAPEAAPVSS